jgi:hypothetical protein
VFFTTIEASMLYVAENIIPEEKKEKFEEFHAYELYNGYGIFDGIDPNVRFQCIEALLSLINKHDIGVVYGAVDLRLLKTMVWADAPHAGIAFRICANGISQFFNIKVPHEFALLIADEGDKEVMKTVRVAFRQLRARVRPGAQGLGKLWPHIHDEMYFGNSRESIGLQLADLCAYFIAKHLEGDVACERFYEIIKPHIAYSQVEPENKSQPNWWKE